jgi:hypothetical protein
VNVPATLLEYQLHSKLICEGCVLAMAIIRPRRLCGVEGGFPTIWFNVGTARMVQC